MRTSGWKKASRGWWLAFLYRCLIIEISHRQYCSIVDIILIPPLIGNRIAPPLKRLISWLTSELYDELTGEVGNRMVRVLGTAAKVKSQELRRTRL